ncbi:helix-turn-helix domain-containing protein [Mucilaginibacter calamicampi]|uniref:Helix-turn-helix domain-containing protein n=1 Tax=Mucilaginibacter calamicampi TaxID=1302352 RepID=A0ABW2YYG9_9SPHI
MLNIYANKINNPQNYRQFKCGETLITLYNCPLKSRFQDVWSKHNYIVYVVEGHKTWHTVTGDYHLVPGSCVFIRKGASIVEQFFDGVFCLVMFYLPDDFIAEVLKTKALPLYQPNKKYEAVIQLASDDLVDVFFRSMLTIFESGREPDPSLIEVKFRELILTLAGNNKNGELMAYFCSLLHDPQAVSLQRVMEENFCYNLKLDEFAELSNRSLSTFKRDFIKHFNVSPGKWLMDKRLQYSYHLLTNTDKTVTEAAFESGFENRSHFSRAFNKLFGQTPRSRKKAIAEVAV